MAILHIIASGMFGAVTGALIATLVLTIVHGGKDDT